MKKEYMFDSVIEWLRNEHSMATNSLENTCSCCPHRGNDINGAKIDLIEDLWNEFPLLTGEPV